MRAGLDAAIEAGIDVIVLARISGGIYAGAWQRAMTRDFYRKLVEDLLEEEVAIVVYDMASGQNAAPVPRRLQPTYTLIGGQPQRTDMGPDQRHSVSIRRQHGPSHVWC